MHTIGCLSWLLVFHFATLRTISISRKHGRVVAHMRLCKLFAFEEINTCVQLLICRFFQ